MFPASFLEAGGLGASEKFPSRPHHGPPPSSVMVPSTLTRKVCSTLPPFEPQVRARETNIFILPSTPRSAPLGVALETPPTTGPERHHTLGQGLTRQPGWLPEVAAKLPSTAEEERVAI